jgi:hypothetical protein
LYRSYLYASDGITTQFVAQTAKGNVEDFCGVGSIAATGIERKHDMLSHGVGECRVILQDHHDLTCLFAACRDNSA